MCLFPIINSCRAFYPIVFFVLFCCTLYLKLALSLRSVTTCYCVVCIAYYHAVCLAFPFCDYAVKPKCINYPFFVEAGLGADANVNPDYKVVDH